MLHLAWSASGQADYRTSDDNARWVATSLELVDAAVPRAAVVWLTGTVVDDTVDAPDAYTRSKAELRSPDADAVEAGTIGWLRPDVRLRRGARRPALVELAASAARGRDEALDLRIPDAAHDFVHAEDVGRAVALAVARRLHGISSGRFGAAARGSPTWCSASAPPGSATRAGSGTAARTPATSPTSAG